jgi:hypothetical protein
MKQGTAHLARSFIAGLILLAAPVRPGMASDAPQPPAMEPCPQDMVFIPAGEFLKGWDNGEPDERPEVVQFTGPYCIDAYEFPNKKDGMPAADVSFEQAAQSCAAQNKRLCNEPEWERACRGPRGLVYTSTQDYNQIRCNLNSAGAQAAGANPECGNAYGVLDMTGNLWEWVDGVYSEENPWPLIKGGSFKKGALFASCYARFTQPPEAQSDSVGFRCCADAANESIPKYGDGCGANPGPFIHDDILALKQDAKVVFILFVAPEQIPGSSNNAPRAIIMQNDGTASLINNAEKSKDKWALTGLAPESAKSIADSVTGWFEANHGPETFNYFWSCPGTRIYAFHGDKETWISISQKTAAIADPVLSGIADKVLALPLK